MKKALFFILSAETVLRGLALIMELIFKNPYMPIEVIILNVVLFLGGAAISLLWIFKKVKIKLLQIFYCFDLIFAVFSLFYFAKYSLLYMYWFEFPLTGNLLSILIYIFVLFFSFRRSKYIHIKSDFYDSDKK